MTLDYGEAETFSWERQQVEDIQIELRWRKGEVSASLRQDFSPVWPDHSDPVWPVHSDLEGAINE